MTRRRSPADKLLPARRRIRRAGAALGVGTLLLVTSCAVNPREIAMAPSERAALTAWRAGYAAEAADRYLAVAAAARDDARLWREAAVAARDAGRLESALLALRQARRIEPAARWDGLAAARTLLRLSRTADALAELPPPADPWDFITRGQILRRAGRPAEALADFDRAAALAPGLALPRQEAAETLAALGRAAESASAYADALAIDPTQTHLQVRLAGLDLALSRTAAAYERFRRLLLMDEGHPAAKAGKEKLAAAHPELAAAEGDLVRRRREAFAAVPAPRCQPMPAVALAPLAVGIVTGATEFRCKAASAVRLDAGSGWSLTLAGQTEIAGVIAGANLALSWSGGGVAVGLPLDVTPVDPDATIAVFNVHFEKGSYWSNEENRIYRGTLAVIRSGDRLTLVNRVPIEDYLLSVVPSEVPAAWPAEALKAQVVAARSETLAKLHRHAGDGFDVCATQHCAVYRGIGVEQAGPTAAVLATRGEFLMTDRGPVDAVYAANCGGFTSSTAAVWGSGEAGDGTCDLTPEAARAWSDVPADPELRERFLRASPAAWCNTGEDRSAFRWVRSYAVDELSAIVDRRYHLGALRAVRVGARTREGWVTSVTFVGERGEKEVRRDAIRGAFGGLRSNQFILEWMPATGDVPAQVLLTGAGWGHGAGMCQDGLLGLARHGRGYRAIMAHYFPHARLETKAE